MLSTVINILLELRNVPKSVLVAANLTQDTHNWLEYYLIRKHSRTKEWPLNWDVLCFQKAAKVQTYLFFNPHPSNLKVNVKKILSYCKVGMESFSVGNWKMDNEMKYGSTFYGMKIMKMDINFRVQGCPSQIKDELLGWHVSYYFISYMGKEKPVMCLKKLSFWLLIQLARM